MLKHKYNKYTAANTERLGTYIEDDVRIRRTIAGDGAKAMCREIRHSDGALGLSLVLEREQ